MMLWTAAMIGLQIKHFLVDFCLQSQWILQDKGRYGGKGGLAHAALHGAGSLAVLICVADPTSAFGLALLDTVLHYHIDWAKEHVNGTSGPETRRYWIVFGVDQLLHQLTMLIILALALSG